MLKQLLAAAAIAAATGVANAADPVEMLPVTPDAMPSPVISGYGEIYGAGYLSVADGDEEWAWGGGGVGRVNVPFDMRWNFQSDAFVDYLDFEGGSALSLGGFGHAYWRDPASHAVGLLGGITELIVFPDGDDTADAQIFSIGAEGQIYSGNTTFYGQGVYGYINVAGDSGDVVNLRGVARHFFNPNLRLDAELAYSWLGGSGGTEVDTYSGALQVFHRFANSPVAIFGRYDADYIEIDSTDDGWVHTFMVGFRIMSGTETLLEEDRYGATMDTGKGLFSVY